MPILRSRQSRRNVKNVRQSRNIDSLIDNVDSSMKSLYSDTYLSDRSNLDNLAYVTDRIEDNINAIVKRNNRYDLSSISQMYSRVMRKDVFNSNKIDKQLSSELESLFGDSKFTDAILGSYLSNKWISDLDKEIDTVIKYLPKLREALDVLKESVLAADSTSKDFIYPRVSKSDDTALKIITDRIAHMEKKYGLTSIVEDCYDRASTYGEAFVYRVPYNKAISRLLATKKQMGAARNISMPMMENGCIVESSFTKLDKSYRDTHIDNSPSFDVEIYTGALIESYVEEAMIARQSRKKAPKSIMESYMEDLNGGETIHEKTKLDRVVPDDLEIPEGLNNRGDFNKRTGVTNVEEEKLNTKGCIIKLLDRHNLIRLYVDDICLGYYYLEFKDKNDLNMNYHMDTDKNLGYSKSISTIEKTITDSLQDSKVDHLMKMIAMQISEKLDATFVNSNQDLTKEIYAILKYNDIFNSNMSVRVSFIPPEDIKWLRFKEDRDLHMGVSDLNDSLLPAKLLAMLYITFTTGTLTRGQDKRVYYVKQTIETNIAQTLLNVINQIKKSNFNMRSIENLNNLLNITGRFNDYIIPVGPSGDAPIQFEIMPGQQFEINQELMNMLEEMVINPLVPLELIQARMSPDFATQFTTSSLKLLRKTYRRQAKLELFASSLYTDVYAAEYDEFQQIDCELPPPVFLSLVNTNQLLENAKQQAETIAEMEYAGETSETVEQEKAIFIKKMVHSRLATYVRPDEISRLKDAAKFEVSKNKPADDNSGDEM